MKILRTPDSRFDNLKDYPFEPNYTDIQTADGSTLRIHHLDEGPADGPIIFCLHGQPVWSYLYRKMIPLLIAQGMRVIAPDMPGYGKSDKPAAREDYSYQNQVDWMVAWLDQQDFTGMTFFGQDWGGLIGLRLIAERSERFERVVISNTGLPYNPEGDPEVLRKVEAFRASAPTPTLPQMGAAIRKMEGDRELAFAYWQKFCWETEDLPVGFLLSSALDNVPRWRHALRLIATRLGLAPLRSSTAIGRAYEAPFPDPSFKMCPRAMPSYVPTLPNDPSLDAQARAWEFYSNFEKPFLCAFTDDDPITAGGDAPFLEKVPGAKGQPHTSISGGGHFVQENRPAELVKVIVDFVNAS